MVPWSGLQFVTWLWVIPLVVSTLCCTFFLGIALQLDVLNILGSVNAKGFIHCSQSTVNVRRLLLCLGILKGQKSQSMIRKSIHPFSFRKKSNFGLKIVLHLSTWHDCIYKQNLSRWLRVYGVNNCAKHVGYPYLFWSSQQPWEIVAVMSHPLQMGKT